MTLSSNPPADSAMPAGVWAAVCSTAQTIPQVTAGKQEVGAKLRKIRKQRRLTLQQLAKQSGIATSTISKAERGQIALSYEKVLRLGQALDIDMTRLFMVGDSGHSPDQPPPTVVKAGVDDAQRYQTEQYVYSVLCGAFPEKKMQPLVATINAREASAFPESVSHPGQEFAYVLSGQVRIAFANGESVELNTHESAYFDSGVGHVYLSMSEQPAQVLSVCICSKT